MLWKPKPCQHEQDNHMKDERYGQSSLEAGGQPGLIFLIEPQIRLD
jgi:hypothetical protein